MKRSPRLELMHAAFANWRVPGYLGSAAYRIRPIAPVIFESMMNMPLTLHTRQGIALSARLRDVNGPAEVFGTAEYVHEWLDWSRVRFVVDVGAHVGSFAIWAASNANCRIASFEPNPAVRKLLQQNVERLRLGSRITIYPQALAAAHGVRHFSAAPDTAASSFADEGALEVETIPLKEAIELTGFPRIDLLKIDIEGAEFEVFRTVPAGALAGVAFCIVECHLSPGSDCAPIATFLRGEGFELQPVSKSPSLELLIARRKIDAADLG